MGRKKKFVNNTPYPDWVIESFARCIYDDVLAFSATEEGQQEHEAWETEQQRKVDFESIERSRHNGKIDSF